MEEACEEIDANVDFLYRAMRQYTFHTLKAVSILPAPGRVFGHWKAVTAVLTLPLNGSSPVSHLARMVFRVRVRVRVRVLGLWLGLGVI